MAPKVREVIQRLEREGWVLVRTTGSHRHFKHPTKPGLVTVSGPRNEELQEGTWRNIRRQAGWRS